MKCARRSCDETVNVIAKHRENGNTYCIRCARMINDAHEEELCTWDDGPTAPELALVAKIEATTTRAELAALDPEHMQLPPHPTLGRHCSGCRSNVCPVVAATLARYHGFDVAERLGLFGMSAIELVEYMLGHGDELFANDYGSGDYEAQEKIRERIAVLKLEQEQTKG